jgi:hypothetical protein
MKNDVFWDIKAQYRPQRGRIAGTAQSVQLKLARWTADGLYSSPGRGKIFLFSISSRQILVRLQPLNQLV